MHKVLPLHPSSPRLCSAEHCMLLNLHAWQMCPQARLTDRKLAGRLYTTPPEPQMTVAPNSDRKAAEGLWSKKNAMDSSATEPSRKGTLECSRVSPAAVSAALQPCRPYHCLA